MCVAVVWGNIDHLTKKLARKIEAFETKKANKEQEKLEAKGLSAGAAASQTPTPQSSQRGKKRPRA